MRLRCSLALFLLSGCSLATSNDYGFQNLDALDGGSDARRPDAASEEDAGDTDDADVDAAADDGGVGPVCSTREQVCNDTFDDDCDSKADCDDEDCRGASNCCTPSADSELDCEDQRDDDCDGRTDCVDNECRQTSVCCPAPRARDRRDGLHRHDRQRLRRGARLRRAELRDDLPLHV